MKGIRIFRIVTWCLVAIVATWLIVFGYVLPLRESETEVAAGIATPAIGKPFELVSHKGEVVNNASLRGKPYLAFFGFTHCPDICPTTLFELTDLMNELGPLADRFNIAFISVDPERDTQEMLDSYMTSFDTRIMALRGNSEQTETAVKAFAAYARKVPTEGGNYTMDHTAGVYLMDAEGRFKGTLDMHEPREVRLQKIRRFVNASS
ncbi:SCO family protein [Rhizobium sp. LC145]|uniref:SCO family protein n=1 Tax=Rhizobium sp. LC145 TaxID=1120688 RepID=UPI000629F5AC|nr:SCO family protein [Rhizobium sp. LC145]KKX29453.1 copper-binding protein [Rhizobium sp. LC145]MDX3927996.1 SCO family protein [Shinella sp.]TKT66168.1 SCO family protein [Rhizobiaceae bacterium LC148]